MALILVRNLAIGHILYGGWHHFLCAAAPLPGSISQRMTTNRR